MSTRSCIIIKVKNEDLNKVKLFKPELLPVEQKTWGTCGQESKELSRRVKLTKPYIGIYCHSDGYPSGVGKVLKEKFTDYETILNLIVGGDCSFVWFDGVMRYGTREGEEWRWISPTREDNPFLVASHIDHEYAYLFENGKWVMKHCSEDTFHNYSTED